MRSSVVVAGLASVLVLLSALCAHAQQVEDLDGLRQQAMRTYGERNFAEALAAFEAKAAASEAKEVAAHGTPGKQTAVALGQLAHVALLANAPQVALKAADRALVLSPALLWISASRAHALLLLGREQEARKIYSAHRGKKPAPDNDLIWEDAIAADFDALRDAGVSTAAFATIDRELSGNRVRQRAKVAELRATVVRLLGEGRLIDADAAAERLIAFARQLYGTTHSEHASALTLRGQIKSKLDRVDDAEKFYTRSLSILEQTLGPQHHRLLDVVDSLALLYRTQSRRDEVAPLHRRSLEIAEKAFGPNSSEAAVRLYWLGTLYVALGRLKEAEPLLERCIGIRETIQGPSHPDVGTAVGALADLYRQQRRLAAAEGLALRRLKIAEGSAPADESELVEALGDLAMVLQDQRRYADAEVLLRSRLTMLERSNTPPSEDLGDALFRLGSVLLELQRLTEAETHLTRSLAIQQQNYGPDHPLIAAVLAALADLNVRRDRLNEAESFGRRALAILAKANDSSSARAVALQLAGIYRDLARFGDSEALLKRALADAERSADRDGDVHLLLHGLALTHLGQGRTAMAEPLLKRSLDLKEKMDPIDEEGIVAIVRTIGQLYQTQGRDREAELLLQRAQSNATRGRDRDDELTAGTRLALGVLYREQQRYPEAEVLLERSLESYERVLGGNHSTVARALNELGELRRRQQRLPEAERLHRRSLEIWEKALGAAHTNVGTALNDLGLVLQDQHRFSEAEDASRRALANTEKTLGPNHPDTAVSLHNLALLAYEQGDWQRAGDYWRRGLAIIKDRARLGLAEPFERSVKKEEHLWRRQFGLLSKVLYRLHTEGGARPLESEAFELAQWGEASRAASALAQMAARSAARSSALSTLVRERQDLQADWQAKDKLLLEARALEPANRKPATERLLSDRLAAIDARLSTISEALMQRFPRYAAIVRPLPLSVDEVQEQLRPDEALVFIMDTPDRRPLPGETFVWVVTKSRVAWTRSNTPNDEIAKKVAALRCGLDEEEWTGATKATRCAAYLGREETLGEDEVPPFDLAIAHDLYKGLLGDVETLIDGKHLLIVASGPMASLPLHVLVKRKPEAARPSAIEDYRKADWLARSHAITVLPSVSSLKALRADRTPQTASATYIGIGDPVLQGTPGACRTTDLLERCPTISTASQPTRNHRTRRYRRDATANPSATFLNDRRDRPLIDEVRALCPLPDTAYELKCVGERFASTGRDIVLGARATEKTIKKLSSDGVLARYKIIHFATHGLMAGDFESMAKVRGEPALVLTPPETPGDPDDNGLLTASEVADLKLGADWVVLSACSTAAGDGESAEALSGLSRAFFYAGTRALLVSHWPVYSDAAVQLTLRTFAEEQRNPDRGRSEAFRRAMVALIDDPSVPSNAHPTVWAPFVVVGEGNVDLPVRRRSAPK